MFLSNYILAALISAEAYMYKMFNSKEYNFNTKGCFDK